MSKFPTRARQIDNRGIIFSSYGSFYHPQHAVCYFTGWPTL